MNHPERVQPTNPGKRFPLGDIDMYTANYANAWMQGYSKLTDSQIQRGRFTTEINVNQQIYARAMNKTHEKALELCDAWDEYEESKDGMTKSGYVFGVVLRTHLFSSMYADFSNELDYMKNEQRENARLFGATAWRGMEATHPKLHEIYARYTHLAVNLLELKDDKPGQELFRTGLMVPYVLGVGTRLAQLTPTFSSMRRLKSDEDLLPVSHSLTQDIELMTSAPHSTEDYLKLKGHTGEL